MKYFFVLLLITSLQCFAQDYKTQITTFREKYKSDFLTDPSSPLKKADLELLQFYDIDSTFRVEAKVEMILNPPTFIMPVFNGAGQQYARYAKLKFTLKGKPMELTIYRSIALAAIPQYKDYLFLPFTDETNGKDTYGGGRYIDMLEGDIKNGTLAVDFNKAYNPYCAFSSGYSCPKPPEENNLVIKIEAGEKLFAGSKSH